MKRKPVAPSNEYKETRSIGYATLGIHDIEGAARAGTKAPQDCGVIAVSLVTGVPYEQVLPELLKRGLKLDRGAPAAEIRKALRAFGYRAIQISQQSIIRRYPASKHGKTFVTPRQVERFPSAWRNLPPILMWTEGHVLLVKDRAVHDWSAGHSIRAYRLDIVVPLDAEPEEYLRQYGLEGVK